MKILYILAVILAALLILWLVGIRLNVHSFAPTQGDVNRFSAHWGVLMLLPCALLAWGWPPTKR